MADPAPGQGVIQIDLDAITANWRDLCTLHGAPVAGVVKADGYGLGAGPIARALMAAGCQSFFVAHLTEGLALRQAIGAGPDIIVLNGFPPGADGPAALLPVLNSLGDVAAHAAAGRAEGRARPALLHIDTGMARLGLDAAERTALAADPGLLAGLDLRFVMTHLACADVPTHPLNASQAADFAAAAAALAPGVPLSFANSSGLFLGPDFRSDLARPGCALYGINPTPTQPNPMRQVVTLQVPVLQIRQIPAGQTVGYGASYTAPRELRLATVAAGYADGYLRSLSGQSLAQFQGRAVPLTGRVSMDLTIFDVTDCSALQVGDSLTLIGGVDNTPDDIAARCGTIGYEVLTSLGRRYLRSYAGGA